MTLTQRLCGTAVCLSVALVALSPSASLAGDPVATTAKTKAKCKKGYVRKGGKCKKKPVSKLPANGDYSAGNGITLTVEASSGKRYVSVRAMVPITCPSGPTTNVGFLVRKMPITGTTFTGQSAPDPEFGQTTMSGKFPSAKSIHLTVQVANYLNGPGNVCSGQLDVTTTLRATR